MSARRFLRGTTAVLVLATLSQCFTRRESEGQQLYLQQCASCHMDDGSGLRGLIPPLAGSDYLTRHRDQLACVIRYGQQGEVVVNGRSYNKPMPGNTKLTEVHLVNLLNYIQSNFGNNNKPFTVQEVKQALQRCR